MRSSHKLHKTVLFSKVHSPTLESEKLVPDGEEAARPEKLSHTTVLKLSQVNALSLLRNS